MADKLNTQRSAITLVAALGLEIIILVFGAFSREATFGDVQKIVPVQHPLVLETPIVRLQAISLTHQTPRRNLTDLYQDILVTEPGCAYGKFRQYSHYPKRIVARSDGLNGNSRRWGDASYLVQAQIISKIITRLKAEGYSQQEIGFALALIRCESGFNPDAAAGYSSAAGLLQLIDDTRIVLAQRRGVTFTDPFCPDAGIECLVEALKEMFAFASKHAAVNSDSYYEFAYAYHHDGPTLMHGGREIACKKVLPWIKICAEVAD